MPFVVSNDQNAQQRRAHPDFDGHIEHPMDVPLTNENILERLRLAWEGALMLQWARGLKNAARQTEEQTPCDDAQRRQER